MPPPTGNDDANASAAGAPPAARERASVDAKPPEPTGGEPSLAPDSALRVSHREADAERERAIEPKKAVGGRSEHGETADQYRRRQLDEFRAEHHDRIRPFDGVEHVGSVVAAAVGSAIVHVGRLEYVDVPLAAGSVPPEVGTHVNVDRAGNVAAVASPEHARENVREAISLERKM